MSLARRSRNQGYTLNPPWDTTHEYNAIAVGSPRTLPPLSHRGEAIQELVPVVSSDIPLRIENLEERVQVTNKQWKLQYCLLYQNVCSECVLCKAEE